VKAIGVGIVIELNKVPYLGDILYRNILLVTWILIFFLLLSSESYGLK
jgi:hypothetical protein